MLSPFRQAACSLAAILISGALAASCQKVPLLAPSGSIITLTSSATALPINGTTQILAVVIDAAGVPPHSGTQVTFTTSLGSMQPASVETDVNGQAVATFNAGSSNGTATITAISGGASASGSAAVKIAVGTAAVGRINLSASPNILPPTGGTTTVTAVVFDINGNALPSAPVSFSTTSGTLSQVIAVSDKNGVSTTTLLTTTSATVTASVGAAGSTTAPPTSGGTSGGTTGGSTGGGSSSGTTSATTTINVAGAPTLVITPPTTAPTAGLPSSFTFAVTAATSNGSAIKDLSVDWGDGSPVQDLGAVTGNAVVSHIYRGPGTYTIRGTVTDASGYQAPTLTAVTVNPATIPITLTAPTTPPGAGIPAVFTIAPGTLPAGDFIRDVQISWGDGTSGQDLGAITGSTTVSHVFANAGTYPVTATVTDAGGNTSNTATTVTVVATPNPTIIITPSVATATMTATFTIQVTPPTGVGVTDAFLVFGDGATQDLGGLTGTITVTHVYIAAATYTVTLTVTDTLGRKTTGSTTVIIP